MGLINKLNAIADSIRAKTGSTEKLTLEQMATAVTDIETTPETIILVDKSGNEVTAILTDEVVEITATPNDVRAGTTAVMSTGLGVGTKEIPAYVVAQGYRMIAAGSDFELAHTDYDYTKLQALFCAFNTSLTDSVSTDRVAIEDVVYGVSSTEALSSVTKDHDNTKIVFGITNETDNKYLIRYFMYKEIY